MEDQQSQQIAQPQEPRHEGGQPGNDNGLRFKTPEERQQFLYAYIEHCKSGKSDECFRFRGAGSKTFKHYREMFPVEFPTELIEDAQAARMDFWETIGIDGTRGLIKGFNAKSWEFNMKNRFKWVERTDVTTDGQKIEAPVVYMPNEKDE